LPLFEQELHSHQILQITRQNVGRQRCVFPGNLCICGQYFGGGQLAVDGQGNADEKSDNLKV